MAFGFRPGRNANQATYTLELYRKNANNPFNSRNLNSIKLKYSNYLKLKYKIDQKIDIKLLNELNKKEGKLCTFQFRDYLNKPFRTKVSQEDTFIMNKKTKQSFYKTQHILDADIKGCFDNISHNWLLDNVPMPLGFEYLIPIILKPKIIEQKPTGVINSTFNRYIASFFNKIKCFNKTTIFESGKLESGVPQGGIISPL